jgi:hypothetical protein
MKSRLVRAGERVKIIRKYFSSVPATFTFEAAPAEGSGPVSGTIEVWGSTWVFPREPLEQPLEAHNTVEKGFSDTFFSVYVTSDRDVTIGPGQAVRPIVPLVITALVTLAAIAVVVAAYLS